MIICVGKGCSKYDILHICMYSMDVYRVRYKSIDEPAYIVHRRR